MITSSIITNEVAKQLGLEIERRGHSRTPLGATITLCSCFSCSCCKE
jgi:hypothetical protein